ncbi:hypothetical protein [Nocardia sp. NPDC051463]|uniref:hypothetical protein n=1 Tax=Nocardia sp. NPDC051463 TaxID=3154845 RepID=UPI00345107BA
MVDAQLYGVVRHRDSPTDKVDIAYSERDQLAPPWAAVGKARHHGLCGLTVVMKPDLLNILYPRMTEHPNFAANSSPPVCSSLRRCTGQRNGWGFSSKETNGAPFIVSGIDNRSVPEARAAGVRIEAMQLPRALGYLANRISARYGLPVSVGDDYTALAVSPE